MSLYSWRKRQRVEDKVRKADRKQDLKQAKANDSNQTPVPALLVKLLQDVGKLPAGPVFGLPNAVAVGLLLRRLARPVASFDIQPDAVFKESDLIHAALPDDLAGLIAVA